MSEIREKVKGKKEKQIFFTFSMKPQKSVHETLKFNRWKTNFHGEQNRQIDLDFNALWNCCYLERLKINERVIEKKEKQNFVHIFNETTE